jgi:uncharacterized protein
MDSTSDRKLAVVTGSSSGIGLELAKQCAMHDFDVLLCAGDAMIHGAAAQIAAQITLSAEGVQADLSTREGIERLVDAVRQTRRSVDALVLNLGFGVAGCFVETDLDAELATITLHCNHTVHLAKRMIPGMMARGSGRMLITTALSGATSSPHAAVHRATTAFVMAFAEALRVEVAGAGVTITTLQPGPSPSSDDAAHLARRGIEAMMAGNDWVFGGSKSRLAGFAGELPEAVRSVRVAMSTEPDPRKA